jgi:class 3 adenylate cyclase
MTSNHGHNEVHLQELRLFLEEICCNLCRFRHVEEEGVDPETVRISQTTSLGMPGLFTDIRVKLPDRPPYFVEVKYGYPPEQIVSHLERKYGCQAPRQAGPSKVILVVDAKRHPDWPQIQRRIEAGLQPGLTLEIWDEERLSGLISSHFDTKIDSVSSEADVIELRTALTRAKGRYAFGNDWTGSELQTHLLWHFGFWRLKQLREKNGLLSRAILPPGMYREVAVLIADLCSFSSCVRDTPDDAVVRHALTSFYSKARYEVLNTGGMLYQFVGDEVIALYGIPDQPGDYLQAALECARSLVDIGNSVSHEWQRHIDRVQTAEGVHIGMALGDVQVVSLQPFGRAHLGTVSDGINMAARLLGPAGPSEIVVSNSFYQALDAEAQAPFVQIEPVDAHNVGRINAWRLPCAAALAPHA